MSARNWHPCQSDPHPPGPPPRGADPPPPKTPPRGPAAGAASGGNGMGLMFCQRVMLAAGGQVLIRSMPGAGTTVELQFERGVQPEAAEAT